MRLPNLNPMATKIRRLCEKESRVISLLSSPEKERYIEQAILDFIKSGAVYLIQTKNPPAKRFIEEKNKMYGGFLKLMINFKEFHPTCADCKYWDFRRTCLKNENLKVNHTDYCGKHSDLEAVNIKKELGD